MSTISSNSGHRWQVVFLVTLPLKEIAAASEKSPTSIFDAANLINVFGSLLLVFVCIFGLVFLLKKINGLPASDRTAISILASRRVGSREKIILIEAGEQHLLIGATPNSIRTLHVFDSPIEDLSESPGSGMEFSSLMGMSASTQKTP